MHENSFVFWPRNREIEMVLERYTLQPSNNDQNQCAFNCPKKKKRLIWIPMASAARWKTRERHNSQNIDTEIMLCALKPKRQRKKTKKIAKHFANDIKIIIVHYEFRELTMTVTGFRFDWCKPMPMIHHNSVHSHSHTNSNCGKDGGARARRAET